MSQNQSIIKSLSSDPGAVAHYKQWANTLQPTVEELDTGLSYSNFANRQQPQVQIKLSDGVTPEEYYRWVIEKINELPVDLGITVAESLHKETGIKIPYLFTDYNSSTRQDITKKNNALSFINQKKQSLIQDGYEESSDYFKTAMILSIKHYVHHEMDITTDPDAKTLEGITQYAQATNCHGASNSFYGLLLMAGLSPQIQTVEWKEDKSISHTRLYVPLQKKSYAVDDAMNIFGSLPIDEVALETSASDFIANYYYNLIIENPEMKSEKKRPLVESALKLAPYNYRVLSVAIMFYEAEGQLELSSKLLQNLLEVYPHPDEASQMFPSSFQYLEKQTASPSLP